MESMVGTCFFFTMDLKSGFWQVKMAKDSQQYTAFMVGSMGVYEFLRMPYGLCNTPRTFQMKPGTANLKAIAEMAPPRTYTEIRRFTGMTGFFRRFIKGYSKIAKPLNDLLEGEAS